MHVERRPIAVVAEEASPERQTAPAVHAVDVRVEAITWLQERLAEPGDCLLGLCRGSDIETAGFLRLLRCNHVRPQLLGV